MNNTKRGARPRRPAASISAIVRELNPTAKREHARAVEELRENLRAALAYTHVSASELARRIKKQRAAVSKILAGKQGTSIENLAAIAHALGMSLHVSLRTPAATVPMPRDPDQHGADAEARAVPARKRRG